jgi:hypothetical protein
MRTSWRERLTTALLVVVVAVPVGIVIGGGLDLGGPDEAVVDAATAPTGPATTTTTSAPTSTSTTAPAVRDPLANSTRTSLAGRPATVVVVAGAAVTVGRRLEPLGYVVLRPAPSPPEPLAATAIFHREGFAAEAAAVARDLGLAGVGPAPFPPVPEIAGAATADVVVIVADDAVAAAGAAPAG